MDNASPFPAHFFYTALTCAGLIFITSSEAARATHRPKPPIEAMRVFTLYPSSDAASPVSIREAIQTVQHNHRSRIKRSVPSSILIKDPATDNTRAVWSLHPGICTNGNSERLALISRGRANHANPKNGMPDVGGGIFMGYTYIKNFVLHNTPCILFDYNDKRRYFNFAQDLDLHYLSTVYNEITAHHQNSSLTLIGDCRGALALLKFVSTHDVPQVDTLILGSPFISADALIYQAARCYLRGHAKRFLRWAFRHYFPNYDPQKDTLMNHISNIKGKRIFIAHRTGDYLVSDESVQLLARELKKNNEVYLVLITCNDGYTHSRVEHTPEYQYAVNAFLKKYSMPHDAQYAVAGAHLLESSYIQ